MKRPNWLVDNAVKRDRAAMNKTSGFTLLEVLVALAIIGSTLPFLALALANTSRMSAESRDLITASHLLRDKMSELESVESLPSGQSQGEFVEGARFQWQTQISPTTYNSLYDVSVIVTWLSGGRPKRLGARTYIMGEAQEANDPSGQGGG